MRSSSKLAIAVFSGLAPILLPTISSAQQPMQLPGIYVQSPTISAQPVAPGAPTDTAQTVAGIPQEQVGSAVTVVTAQDIERQQIQNAHDALRSLPGVSVGQQGTPGNLTVVRIRGAESRHTLVVIDGVEVNSGTDGFFDFSNLSTADIERIEVLRGPQSGLYGNSAIGGVISITTKSGRGPLALSLKAEGGTQRTGSLTAQLSGGNQAAWGSVVVHGFNTAGFNTSALGGEDDATRIGSFAARGGFALSPNFRIEGIVREHNTHAEYDRGFAQLYKGFFAPADAPFYGDARLRVGSVQATLDTLNKLWIHNFYVQGSETLREDTTTSPLETNSTNSKFGYKSTLEIAGAGLPFRHFLTGMIERRRETFEQPTFSKTVFERERDTLAAEIRGEYFKSLFLNATVRHDQNSTTEDFTTWHASGSYLVPGNVFRVHASIGTGVKYPSFGDLHGFFLQFAPNPNLRPEESTGYDFGVETKLLGGRAAIDVTYFHADLTQRDRACLPAANVHLLALQPVGREHQERRRGRRALCADAPDHAGGGLHLPRCARGYGIGGGAPAPPFRPYGRQLCLPAGTRQFQPCRHLQRADERPGDGRVFRGPAHDARCLLADPRGGLLQAAAGRGGVRACGKPARPALPGGIRL